ncbi:hypothetical protein [Micromonospora sp. NPDC049107]|uniref:hypothetical protein n=1 Tax=unclassified Micromonospora TaxID=2617518 RepID=UPI0033F46AF7
MIFQPPDPDRPLPRQTEPAPAHPESTPVKPPAAASDAPHPTREPAGTAAHPTREPADDTAHPTEEPAGTGAHPTRKSAKKAAQPAQGAARPAQDEALPGAAGEPTGQPPRARAPRPRKTATSTAAVAPTPPPPAPVIPDATPVTPEPTEITPTPRKRATPTRRAATAKAGAPAVAPAPAPEAASAITPEPAAAAVPPGNPEAASTRTPELPAVVARLRDHPGFAPEFLAMEAVRTLGPGAAEWTRRLRDRYPDAPADGLARLATRRYVRAAGAGGAAAALAGLFAPLAELVSVLWTQANLVLHLAAAYGRDPAHPDRAEELLVLTQVHPDAASARAALLGAREAGDPVEGTWPKAAEAAWRLAAPLTAQAGGWVALRLASRLVPGAAVVAATLGDAAAADRLAARAVAAYRPHRR